jgi:hypothetical protein
MALDLKLMEERLRAALEAETEESLREWLDAKKMLVPDENNDDPPRLYVLSGSQLYHLIAIAINQGFRGEFDSYEVYKTFMEEYKN